MMVMMVHCPAMMTMAAVAGEDGDGSGG